MPVQSLKCFHCKELVVGFVEELQRHVDLHIQRNHFDPNLVFHDCMVPKCNGRFNHFKSLKRHIKLNHPQNKEQEQDEEEGCEEVSVIRTERVEDPANGPNEGYQDEETAEFEDTGPTTEQIKRSVSLAICRLAKDVSLPQTKISEMINICEMLTRLLTENLAFHARKFIKKVGVDLTSNAAMSFLNCFNFPDLFSSVSSATKQRNFLESIAVDIPTPEEKMLSTREDIRHINGVSTMVKVNETFMYIPIIDTLKLIFRNPETRKLLSKEQDHVTRLPEVAEYNTFRSGSTYQSSDYFSEFPDAIRISLYQDDVELGNALSSRAGINKVSIFDFKIQNMPDKWNSSPRSVFPLIYCTSLDAKKHGYNRILKPLVQDLKKLEKGINVHYGSEVFTLRATVTMFCGDTLAAHDVFGLLGPTATYFCRICTIPRGLYHADPLQKHPWRTEQWYNENLEKVQSGEIKPSECGLKPCGCILNELQNFHITRNYSLDTMHDIAEGIVPLCIQLVLSRYYKNKNIDLRVDCINKRIQLFKYGYVDKKNRPCANITDAMLIKPKEVRLKQTASQNMCLLRSIPFLFADKVPTDCKLMRMIGHLINITRILNSTIISHHLLAQLEEHIRLFDGIFYQSFSRKINKSHHLEHYVECIRRSGNMKQFNCFVFEQKNKPNKDQSGTCKNFINICKSLANRQSFTMIMHILDNTYADAIVYHAGKLVLTEKCKSNSFVDEPYVFIPKRATINGIEFRTNLVVCIKEFRNEYFPCYGIIQELVVINRKLYFLLNICSTNTYNDLLEAYEVEVIPETKFFNIDEIHSHTTFAFWSPYKSNIKYISRRCYHQDY